MAELPAPPQWEKLETLTNVPTEFIGVGGPTQKISATLSLKLHLYSYRENNNPDAIKQKFLKVSLEGSRIAANTPPPANDYVRGYYTEDVDIDIGFDDSRGIQLRAKAPDTTAVTGSVSSSVNLSFSGGFFGETPTVNAGYSISESFSISIPDIEFQDRDENPNRVHHVMRLKLVTGKGQAGAPYVNPTSLISDGNGNLFVPPALAVANLPLPSQALFHAPNGLNEPRKLRIRIDHRVVKVTSTHLLAREAAPAVNPLLGWAIGKVSELWGGPKPKEAAPVGLVQNLPPYDDKKRDQVQRVAVGRVNLEIQPQLCRSEWQFQIPFDKV